MSTQPHDSTPSSTRPTPPPAEEIPRVPWSQVGPEFIGVWGYPGGKFWPEHVEILGPSGSGKTYFDATILQQRVKARDSRVIFVATKKADETIDRLGWPVIDSFDDVRRNRQSVFWPKTSQVGDQREAHLLKHLLDLLDNLWQENANAIIAFDEIATVEDLGTQMKKRVKMYWREARSNGITVVGMKQRPQGIQRDMHSESTWVVSFKPKDEDDALRYAEVLGGKKTWMPVLRALDRDSHEFVMLNSRTGRAVISWVDTELKPPPEETKGTY